MSGRILYSQCPGCKSINIQKVFEIKDHEISGDFFQLFQCNYCTLRFTENVPAAERKKYYGESNSLYSPVKKGFANKLDQFVQKNILRSKKKLFQNITGSGNGSLLEFGERNELPDFINSQWKTTIFNTDIADIKNRFANYDANSFDVITMWNVPDFTENIHAYLEGFRNVLKENGIIFFASPNYISPDGKYYEANWSAYNAPKRVYHFSPASMKEILRQHQMKIAALRPMWFDGFYINICSEKNRSGKNNFFRAVFQTAQSVASAGADIKKCSSLVYIIKKEKSVV